MSDLLLPDYTDVAAAAARIEGIANKTPVMTSRTVNAIFDAELFFKCENFQRMGAFK
ncbi:MAG: serine dehydratase, partial [Gammaproteobacteria bacterium]